MIGAAERKSGLVRETYSKYVQAIIIDFILPFLGGNAVFLALQQAEINKVHTAAVFGKRSLH